jgi:hypothetical protein
MQEAPFIERAKARRHELLERYHTLTAAEHKELDDLIVKLGG